MKKVLYIIGLTSAVFLLSAAEKQQESWTDFALGIGQRVVNLLGAGAGAVMRGAQAVVEDPEEEFVYTGPAQFIGHEYQDVEDRLNYLHALVIAAHSLEYNLLSEKDYELSIAQIKIYKNMLTNQKIASQVSGKVAELERKIKNKLNQEAGNQNKIRKLTELYDNFIKKTEVDQTALTDVLNQESEK